MRTALVSRLVFIFALLSGFAGTAMAQDSSRVCARYHNDAWSCDRDYRCFFSDEIYSCVARDLDCRAYTYNRTTCERTAGCEWDAYWRECANDPNVVDNGGGGGHDPGFGQRVVIPCSSHNANMQTCHVGGVVIAARLLRGTNTWNCQEGRTWGKSRNGVWVSNGCSGRFELIVRRY